jgi:uncharacterized Ntn-hydrolase superfamily protein
MKKDRLLIMFAMLFGSGFMIAQDTFSIVALDSNTGEVGSAGASCVDLFQTPFSTDDFLGELFPGVGAINSQAYYLGTNQNNAAARMNLGDTPGQIIEWLVANDVSNQPELRQYGIVGFVDGLPQSAAHTGASTDDYKNHITGPNYSIQGNILLGQEVLDSMEARFLNEPGDLACKLMAALQGANMVGADSRCSSNGTSSLFAFVKVAQSTDAPGSPSFLASVRTRNNDGIEPIDSLQTKFDMVHSCLPPEPPLGVGSVSAESFSFSLYPNPAANELTISSDQAYDELSQVEIIDFTGKVVFRSAISTALKISVVGFERGVYFMRIKSDGHDFATKFIKE